MNQITIFNNSEFGRIRTASINNEPWFCLSDVCQALDITHVTDVKNRLNRDGVGTSEVIDSMGRTQSAIFINEANLYKTIFQSRKESAERFSDWVTGEVLPSIRRNGAYIAGQEELSESELMAKALIAAQNVIKRREEVIEKLESDYRRMRPKEIFADAVATSKTSILVGELAKIICQNGYPIGQNRLFAWLRNAGYLMKSGENRNMPMQRYIEQGLFEIKETNVQNPDGSVRITRTPKVTGKGQQYFINKFLNDIGR